MKFTAAVKDLAQALGRISSATPQRSPMPVLENLLLELDGSTLTMTATDMDITMSTRLEVRGDRNGALLIPAKRMTDTVKAFEQGECVFDADPTTRRVTLQTGTGEYRLTGLDAADFPQVAKFEPRISITLPQGTFSEMVERTVFACSADEFRPAMTGVLFQFRPEEIRAVATDGFRLVRVIDRQTPADVAEPLDIIVPPKALQLASRSVGSAEIKLEASPTHVRLADGVTTITARLIDETYPNYESVIPQANDKRMIIRREELLNTVRRVSLYSNSQTRQVRMRVGPNGLRVQAEDIDTGGEAFENIPCDYADDDLEI
ncbi:MAG: DNA polymerase III subunit beta, partial [bacterium]|nr:DNA polymerase III subunit beta [Candidatus Kapabacteria bacterium]